MIEGFYYLIDTFEELDLWSYSVVVEECFKEGKVFFDGLNSGLCLFLLVLEIFQEVLWVVAGIVLGIAFVELFDDSTFTKIIEDVSCGRARCLGT